jgi:AraC family transcriptional regulator
VDASITQGTVVGRWEAGIVRVAEALHEPGMRLPLHAHPVPTLSLVLDGSFEEQLDRRRHWCTAGVVIYKPAGAPHANRYGRFGGRSLVVEILRPVRELLEPAGVGSEDPAIIKDEQGCGILLALRRKAAAAGPDVELDIEELTCELVAWLGGAASAAIAGFTSTPPPWLQRVYDRVYEEYTIRPSIRVLAADAGVHPDHVSRAFRHHFGCTIGELVRRRRVEHASLAIRSTARPLSCIALEAGFSDQSHMSRSMRAYLGVTPGWVSDHRALLSCPPVRTVQ